MAVERKDAVKMGRTVANAFLKGVLWGSALSVGAVSIASVIGDPPSPPATSTGVVPGAADPAAEATRIAAAAPTQEMPGKRPMSTAPVPDTLSAVPQDATRSAAVPQVGAVEAMAATVVAPAEAARQAAVGTAAHAPKTSAATGIAAQALVTPSYDPPVSVATEPDSPSSVAQEGAQVALALDPAQPPTPELAGQERPFAVALPDQRQMLSALSISEDPAQPPLPEVVQQTTAFEAAEAKSVETDAPAVNTPAETFAESLAEKQPALSDAPILAQVEGPAAFGSVVDPVVQALVLPYARMQQAPRVLSVLVEQDVLRPARSETRLAAAVSDNPKAPKPALFTPVLPEAAGIEAGIEIAQAAPETSPQEALTLPDTTTPRAPLAPQGAQETQAPEIATDAPDGAAAPAPAARPATLQGGGGGAIPGRQAGTLGNLTEEVRTNRLPTLAAPAEPVEAVPDATPAAVDGSALPVRRFAEAVDNPDGRPMMAIVLMDDGADLSVEAIGLPALRDLPYPVSFAVNALLPDATARMQAYRAEGFEVLAMVDLPEGASARDAEVTLEVALSAMPEVVGLLDGVLTGVQPTRAAADQVAGILAQTGHGFVSQNRGLNTTQKRAAREGVPSAVVSRDIDSAGQSPEVIRRFLDQAAFRAGQNGSVIMLGRLREDTVSALQLWAAQDQAERVAMVPVSGVLTTEE